MGDIVNLRRARKARARAAAETEAAENRVRFGRTKAEKALASAQTDLQARRLAAHRREAQPAGAALRPAPGSAAGPSGCGTVAPDRDATEPS